VKSALGQTFQGIASTATHPSAGLAESPARHEQPGNCLVHTTGAGAQRLLERQRRHVQICRVGLYAQELPSGTIGSTEGSLTPLVQDVDVVAGGTIRISPGMRTMVNNGGAVGFVGSLAWVRARSGRS
jgi:hypothetical protein